jgi:hypothetical protein
MPGLGSFVLTNRPRMAGNKTCQQAIIYAIAVICRAQHGRTRPCNNTSHHRYVFLLTSLHCADWHLTSSLGLVSAGALLAFGSAPLMLYVTLVSLIGVVHEVSQLQFSSRQLIAENLAVCCFLFDLVAFPACDLYNRRPRMCGMCCFYEEGDWNHAECPT